MMAARCGSISPASANRWRLFLRFGWKVLRAVRGHSFAFRRRQFQACFAAHLLAGFAQILELVIGDLGERPHGVFPAMPPSPELRNGAPGPNPSASRRRGPPDRAGMWLPAGHAT